MLHTNLLGKKCQVIKNPPVVDDNVKGLDAEIVGVYLNDSDIWLVLRLVGTGRLYPIYNNNVMVFES